MPRLQSSISWLLILIAHGVLAAAWWWLMPAGFSADHARFWVNQVLPPLAIAIIVALLIAARRKHFGVARAGIAVLAATWFAVAISSRMAFPISLRIKFLIPLVAFACVLITAFAPALRAARLPPTLSAVAVLFGLSLGGWLPLTQRADAPSTLPLNPPDATAAALPPFDQQPRTRSFSGFDVTPSSGIVQLRRGRFTLAIRPMLEFRSRSPDRFWTVFAPRDQRVGPSRVLAGYADRPAGVSMSYRDDGESRLSVEEAGDGWGANMDATLTLPKPVYSHLNTFCEFQFVGHRELSVTFSPCPQTKIDVVHFDYPVGDPARFAYLDTGGVFRVVEASSGEKGPFKMLAEGKMSRDDSLVMTLHDKGVEIARVELLDWARQASTALSPTAGWRVPVNAIEFSRDTEEPDSVASFYVTLAASSVGRGFDSVGHAAGTYRNRVRASWVE